MPAPRAAATASGDRFRPVGQLLWLVAALRLVAAFMTPWIERPTASDQLIASSILLVGHGFLYHFGARFRASQSNVAYIGVQFTLAGSIALFSQSLWLSIALFGALGAQTFVLLRDRPSSALIAGISLASFAMGTSLGFTLVRSAAVALVLATVCVAVVAVRGKR